MNAPITPERLAKPDHYRNQVQIQKEKKLLFSALHGFSHEHLANHSETRDKRAPEILNDFIESVRSATQKDRWAMDLLSGYIIDNYEGERFYEVVSQLNSYGIYLSKNEE